MSQTVYPSADYSLQYDCRRQRLLKAEAQRDLSKDLYGAAAMANLAEGKRIEQANEALRHVAEWFDHTHPSGRDPKGECDFAAMKLCRAYYLFHANALEPDTIYGIRRFFLRTDFASKYASENHGFLFHTARYLMAKAFSEDKWQAYKKSGRELAEEDRTWLDRFLRFRARRGWAEFDSAVYVAVDWECLCCLHDFSADPEIKRLAGMMMDLILAEMAVESLDGMYCGAHGRIYPPQAINHATEMTYSLQHLYFGTGNAERLPHSSVDALTSNYCPNPLVLDIALNRAASYEIRERKHLHNIDDLLPAKPLRGSIRKYTYCSSQYAMGCVQYQDPYPSDKKCAWYAHHQQHEWDLSIAGSTTARLFTHHPGTDGEHNYWTGDLGCGCGHFFQHKSALVALYDIPPNQAHQFIHAYVPRSSFDTVVEEDGVLFVRKGGVCAALRILGEYRWTRDGEWRDREVISTGPRNAVACEAGLVAEWGSFDAFRREVLGNAVHFDAERMRLEYCSKRAGTLWLDARGGRKLDGHNADLDYPSYDSPYMQSAWGSGTILVKNGRRQMNLDFTQCVQPGTWV